MNNEQPESLRLADALANSRRWHELTDDECEQAAVELRRLYAVNQELMKSLNNIVKADHMTLRDYFAAKAVQAIISSDRYGGLIGVNNYEHRSAADAYKVADAMLQARKQVDQHT